MASETVTTEALLWLVGTKVSRKVADVLGEMIDRRFADQTLLE